MNSIGLKIQHNYSGFQMKKKKKMKGIDGKHENQLKIPKPILMIIFQLCGLGNLLKLSLTSKQFYFLIKSDTFWLKMLRETTHLTETEIDQEKKKGVDLVEIYKSSLLGWNINESHLQLIQFNRNEFVHKKGGGVAIAVTKKKFIVGEDNLLFEFEIKFDSIFCGCGISKLDR